MCAPSLMTGKGHRMPVVVRGVVHRLDVGKAHTADDENTEQHRHENGHGARNGQRGGVGAGAFRFGRESIHLVPHAPSTRGRGSRLSRRQVSWLAGRRLPSAFPEQMLQWPYGGVLAAYSCGGSRGIGKIPHRVPFFSPTECGNRRRGDYSRVGRRRKRALKRALARALERAWGEHIDKGGSQPL